MMLLGAAQYRASRWVLSAGCRKCASDGESGAGVRACEVSWVGVVEKWWSRWCV